MPVSKGYRIKSDKMMVCPLHNDINPSLGVIKGKKGEEIYHCFGCNRYGNIVKFHKDVTLSLFKRHISEEESLKELCNIFNVSYDIFSDTQSLENSDDTYVKLELAIQKSDDSFDLYDFKRMMIEGKINGKSVNYFNTITMVMINELNS